METQPHTTPCECETDRGGEDGGHASAREQNAKVAVGALHPGHPDDHRETGGEHDYNKGYNE